MATPNPPQSPNPTPHTPRYRGRFDLRLFRDELADCEKGVRSVGGAARGENARARATPAEIRCELQG